MEWNTDKAKAKWREGGMKGMAQLAAKREARRIEGRSQPPIREEEETSDAGTPLRSHQERRMGRKRKTGRDVARSHMW